MTSLGFESVLGKPQNKLMPQRWGGGDGVYTVQGRPLMKKKIYFLKFGCKKIQPEIYQEL